MELLWASTASWNFCLYKYVNIYIYIYIYIKYHIYIYILYISWCKIYFYSRDGQKNLEATDLGKVIPLYFTDSIWKNNLLAYGVASIYWNVGTFL